MARSERLRELMQERDVEAVLLRRPENFAWYTNAPIETGQAFSWNRSVTGAKAEETFVLTADGPEVVTASGLEALPA